MSLIATFFLASPADAVRYATAPEDFPEAVDYGGFTALELSTLWAIIRGTDWTNDLLDEFDCLYHEADMTMIHQIPSDMNRMLVTLAPDQIREANALWADTEEMDCSPDAIRPILDDLVRLAGLALESGQQVFLFNA
ncbi:MAG: hypothetical protein ABL949_16955 [Fimbriimonadaceae bacterium]